MDFLPSLFFCTPHFLPPFWFHFFNLIFKVFLIKKSLNTIHSLHFWGSDLSPAYILFCSAPILIHALECLRLKGQFYLHFSEPVSISTLIEQIIFNIVLLQQAIIFCPKVLCLVLNRRMLTQRFSCCFLFPFATTLTWLEFYKLKSLYQPGIHTFKKSIILYVKDN